MPCCGRCRKTHYCNGVCQNAHWSSHKANCNSSSGTDTPPTSPLPRYTIVPDMVVPPPPFPWDQNTATMIYIQLIAPEIYRGGGQDQCFFLFPRAEDAQAVPIGHRPFADKVAAQSGGKECSYIGVTPALQSIHSPKLPLADDVRVPLMLHHTHQASIRISAFTGPVDRVRSTYDTLRTGPPGELLHLVMLPLEPVFRTRIPYVLNSVNLPSPYPLASMSSHWRSETTEVGKVSSTRCAT